MDVKTSFLNGNLKQNVFRYKLEVFGVKRERTKSMQTHQEIVWPETSALHSKLIEEIVEEEIKVVVWGMEPIKDPWLDGFNNPILSITLEYHQGGSQNNVGVSTK